MKKLIVSLAFLFPAMGMMAQTQVKTVEGILEGKDLSGIHVFKGVPFAAPPVGNLRWKAPQPAAHWEGVRMAKEYGPNPMQENLFGDMNFGTKKNSEDCLYLNIWTPAKTMKEKLPVLIYFNGGGLMAGSGSEPRYAGDAMARKGIISITANYREGIFGFFAHPQLSKETSYKGSGNYGFMDQVAAIQWVKNNIEAFGGDPDRITIVGESAGSMSVSALMASPLCQGLFAQAMGSSGSVMGFKKIATLKEAEKNGMELAQQIAKGLAQQGDKNASDKTSSDKKATKKIAKLGIKDLRALPAEELMKLASVKSVPTYNIDGYFLTEQPVETFAKGNQTKVPLLIGGNNQEMTPWAVLMGKQPTVENLKAGAKATFGEANIDELFRLYGINSDKDVLEQPGINLASDLFLDYSTWKWGNMHKLTSGQPVYRYRYCHPRPAMAIKGKVAGLAGGVQDAKDGQPVMPQDKGAVHSADIEYAMGTLPTNRIYDWQPEDYMISDIFSQYYVNFVKTGNPNGLGLVEWPSTNGKTIAPVLQIDVNTYVKADEQMEKRYDFIDHLFWK
ncbi:MAG TPA: carboxylesterase [Prevotella sp.]|nr:carboxylesterase [Candidatus Segatella violae]